MSAAAPRWAVIVPVKPAAVGKSRLAAGLREGADRTALARAIALDTIAAAAAAEGVAEVLVVTADAELDAAAAAIPGVRVIAERGVRGLDAAVAEGAEAALPGLGRAALLGDLPALRPEDLAAALRAAADVPRGVVADAEGTGSTLVTARPGAAWSSAFGAGSFARHTGMGFAALAVPARSTLRRDVDTTAHLADAGTYGLGPRTSALAGRGPSDEARPEDDEGGGRSAAATAPGSRFT